MPSQSIPPRRPPGGLHAGRPSPLGQADAPTAGGGPGSPSRYRHCEPDRGVNYYGTDGNLQRTLRSYLPRSVVCWAEEPLHELGGLAGTELARRADVYDAAGPALVRYDKLGRDISQVVHHPDWLASLNEVLDFGAVGWNYSGTRLDCYGRAPYPLLAAFHYLIAQADTALCCPLVIAHGTTAVLERFAGPALRDELLPAITAASKAQRLQAAQVTTEITGGSDVGASRAVARPDADGRWRLTGEKWFASNIGADLIVTLARIDETTPGTRGLGMFVVPRVRRDGSQNAVSIPRLKDKLGIIGVPTGELVFRDAEAVPVGDPGQGFRYLTEMLNHTRFWNAASAAGIMRRSLLEAASYTARRESFGFTVDHFPMMRERLVWLDVDLTATLSLLMHTAAALERAESGGAQDDHLRFRTLAPVVKYRSGEQSVDFARAAVELIGGNGYVTTFATPRLLRDAQVNPIWEGTSNICALDLWRAITRQGGHEPVFGRCEQMIAGLAAEPARRAGEAAMHAVKDAREVITSLAGASHSRQEQQARRVAHLVGDAVALAALAAEADTDVSCDGDHRKAVIAELFALRMNAGHTRRSAAADGFGDVPDLYPALFGDEPLDAAGYRRALTTLGR
jgi:acyl-CoA dehydrogenase